MKRVFRNAEGDLRLIWIVLIGIAAYYAINLLLARLYMLGLTAVMDMDSMTATKVALSDLLLQLPIAALTVIAFAILHRKLLREPLWIQPRRLLIACGATLAGIVGAIMLLTAMGKLRIVPVSDGWAADYGEYVLTTVIYAIITISAAMAAAIFRYCFVCGSVLERLDRKLALLICLLLFGLLAVFGSGGGILVKLNGVLFVALLLLALDIGGAGACLGVLLGQSLGLSFLFGSQNSAYVLMRIVPTSMEATIAPAVVDPLTGGSEGAWGSLWLICVRLLLIAIALLCSKGVRDRLRGLGKKIASEGME